MVHSLKYQGGGLFFARNQRQEEGTKIGDLQSQEQVPDSLRGGGLRKKKQPGGG